MRTCAIYSIAAALLGVILLLLVVMRHDSSENIFAITKDRDDAVNQIVSRMSKIISSDISHLITSQSYYEHLCAMDR